MPYDFDEGGPIGARPTQPANPKDPETLSTLLEVAALSLTTVDNDSFTYEELWAEALCFAGPELPIEEADFKAVLDAADFIECTNGRYRVK